MNTTKILIATGKIGTMFTTGPGTILTPKELKQIQMILYKFTKKTLKVPNIVAMGSRLAFSYTATPPIFRITHSFNLMRLSASNDALTNAEAYSWGKSYVIASKAFAISINVKVV